MLYVFSKLSFIPCSIAIVAGSIAMLHKLTILGGLKLSDIIAIFLDASSFNKLIIFKPALK